MMKRFVTFLFPLLFLRLVAVGNSGPPMALLREVLIDSLGNWSVELYLYQESSIDSIWVGFSSGTSLVNNYTLIAPDDLVVIDNSNLQTPISVNPDGDYVIIRSWGSYYWHYDSLAFGNYPGSYLDCVDQGESYAYVEITGPNWATGFSIDETPTMGFINDMSEAVAYFSGKVYNPNGNVFTEGEFKFVPEELVIRINPDGTFNRPIFARRHQCEDINIKFPPFPYTYIAYTIVPMEFCAIPGASVQQDFVTTGYVNASEPEVSEEPLVIVSPNPFSSAITFYWNAKTLQTNDLIELCIFDQHGKQLLKESLQSGLQRFQWIPGDHLPSGIYIYHLVKNGQEISSGKIVRI
jgi:hypothetical protein